MGRWVGGWWVSECARVCVRECVFVCVTLSE